MKQNNLLLIAAVAAGAMLLKKKQQSKTPNYDNPEDANRDYYAEWLAEKENGDTDLEYEIWYKMKFPTGAYGIGVTRNQYGQMVHDMHFMEASDIIDECAYRALESYELSERNYRKLQKAVEAMRQYDLAGEPYADGWLELGETILRKTKII